MLKVVEKRRAYQDVVEQILALIKNETLKKGDQLPTERDLTETFKVSRNTVREAIRSLESMKLVESRQGDGTYVLLSGKEIEVQHLCTALFHDEDDLREIFHVRNIIEPHISQLAAERATPKEIEELEEIVEQHERHLNLCSVSQTIDTDTAFHMALAGAARNRVMSRLVHALIDLLAESRKEILQSEQRAVESLRGHKLVLDAIKARDSVGARDAMRRHLHEIEKLLFKRKKGGRKSK